MKVNAKRFLESLIGGKHICACGRVLRPVYNAAGKQIGVTHKRDGDEEHHSAFFSGIRIKVKKGLVS